jgi:acetyl-CoA carboxylase biotin carboxylase subunit
LYYDPLLAKLIVHAENRDAAIARMSRALDELLIDGLSTIAPFHRRVMDEPDFRAGSFDTGYVDQHPNLLNGDGDGGTRVAALVAALLEDERRRKIHIDDTTSGIGGGSAWRWPYGGWSNRGWGRRA